MSCKLLAIWVNYEKNKTGFFFYETPCSSTVAAVLPVVSTLKQIRFFSQPCIFKGIGGGGKGKHKNEMGNHWKCEEMLVVGHENIHDVIMAVWWVTWWRYVSRDRKYLDSGEVVITHRLTATVCMESTVTGCLATRVWLTANITNMTSCHLFVHSSICNEFRDVRTQNFMIRTALIWTHTQECSCMR